MKFAFALILTLALSACGNGLPAKYNVNGAQIDIVGEAWAPNGDLLWVRPMRCPWNPAAWAAFRISSGEPSRICLIFKDDEVREAFELGGSLPIDHEQFKWAAGWPKS